MQHPDQKYLEALLNNDTALIEEVYRKYSGKIKWMVLQNNGKETDAADVFQEVLLSIYKKIQNEKFTLTCPLEAFLYTACKNKWLNELRKKKLDKVTMHHFDVYNIDEDSFKIIEEINLQQARRDLLAEKLRELCEDCRQLLQLNWSGKPMEEVATILNITYGYARKKKCECMAELVTLVKHSAEFNLLKQ